MKEAMQGGGEVQAGCPTRGDTAGRGTEQRQFCDSSGFITAS
jgi:hypothetical protein